MKIRVCDFLAPFVPDELEPLRIRTFGPKEYPKGKDNPAPKPFGPIYSTEYTVTRAMLRDDTKLHERIKRENRFSGIYFIVNSGISEAKRLPFGECARKSKYGEIPVWTQYVEDEDITRFNAFFVESDDKSIDEQLAMFECCPLWPCILVVTLKSVHAYWLCLPGVMLKEWTDVQCRLIAYFKSDLSIKNPSRLMRLSNLNHVKYDPETQTMNYKLIEVARFDVDRRFTVDEMRAAFPAVEIKQASDWKAPAAGSGEFRTWEELGNELRTRMHAHPTAHIQGEKVVLQGVCHGGKGNSALFFNTITGKYHCDNKDCTKEDILRAFGLPERPTGQPEIRIGNRIVPVHARGMRITDKSWKENPVMVDFAARIKAAQVAVLSVRDDDVAANFIDGELEGLEAWTTADDTPIERPIGICPDCHVKSELYGSWCFQCSELRRFLNDGPNALTCGCTDVNRWRFRDGGFKWYCGNCERNRAPLDAVWSGVEGRAA